MCICSGMCYCNEVPNLKKELADLRTQVHGFLSIEKRSLGQKKLFLDKFKLRDSEHK